MKPNYALNLTHDGIDLFERSEAGWLTLGTLSLDSDDLEAEIAELRRLCERRAPKGATIKLLIPPSQVLYSRVKAPGPSAAQRKRQIAHALDGRTPYAVSDLAFDWSGTGEEVMVAVVAKETLAEAEEFARTYGFAALSFVTMPEPDQFAGEPWFGTTKMAAQYLGAGERVERDQDPVRIAGAVNVEAGVTADAAVNAAETDADLDPAELETDAVETAGPAAEDAHPVEADQAAETVDAVETPDLLDQDEVASPDVEDTAEDTIENTAETPVEPADQATEHEETLAAEVPPVEAVGDIVSEDLGHPDALSDAQQAEVEHAADPISDQAPETPVLSTEIADAPAVEQTTDDVPASNEPVATSAEPAVTASEPAVSEAQDAAPIEPPAKVAFDAPAQKPIQDAAPAQITIDLPKSPAQVPPAPITAAPAPPTAAPKSGPVKQPSWLDSASFEASHRPQTGDLNAPDADTAQTGDDPIAAALKDALPEDVPNALPADLLAQFGTKSGSAPAAKNAAPVVDDLFSIPPTQPLSDAQRAAIPRATPSRMDAPIPRPAQLSGTQAKSTPLQNGLTQGTLPNDAAKTGVKPAAKALSSALGGLASRFKRKASDPAALNEKPAPLETSPRKDFLIRKTPAADPKTRDPKANAPQTGIPNVGAIPGVTVGHPAAAKPAENKLSITRMHRTGAPAPVAPSQTAPAAPVNPESMSNIGPVGGRASPLLPATPPTPARPTPTQQPPAQPQIDDEAPFANDVELMAPHRQIGQPSADPTDHRYRPATGQVTSVGAALARAAKSSARPPRDSSTTATKPAAKTSRTAFGAPKAAAAKADSNFLMTKLVAVLLLFLGGIALWDSYLDSGKTPQPAQTTTQGTPQTAPVLAQGDQLAATRGTTGTTGTTAAAPVLRTEQAPQASVTTAPATPAATTPATPLTEENRLAGASTATVPAQPAPPQLGTPPVVLPPATPSFTDVAPIIPTVSGTVTPTGAVIFAGRPATVPPARPRSVTVAAAAAAAASVFPNADPALKGQRPKTRPASVTNAAAKAQAAPQTPPQAPEATGQNAAPTTAQTPTVAEAQPAPPALSAAEAAQLAELQRNRPKLRPGTIGTAAAKAEAAAQAEAAAAAKAEADARLAAEAEAQRFAGASDQAVETSRRPGTKPRSIARAVDAAVAAAVASAAPSAPAQTRTAVATAAPQVAPQAAPKTATYSPSPAPEPTVMSAPKAAARTAAVDELDEPEPTAPTRGGPTTRTVANQATEKDALNLRQVNLIGLFGPSSNRRALVRMPSGSFIRVQVGDKLDGGKVTAIGDGQLSYQKSGRNLTLKLLAGG